MIIKSRLVKRVVLSKSEVSQYLQGTSHGYSTFPADFVEAAEKGKACPTSEPHHAARL